ncbi:MAG TPA: hypothetical protein VIA62_15220 [Thermoanaerobaculia bacterium]|nr:hypothetical protein [Thermoanaerobaculia bacterium]
MSDIGARFKEEFSPFRIVVVALLAAIAVLQFLALERMPSVSFKDLRTAKGKERRILYDSLPLVGVYGTVEVGSPVEVEGTVDVNVVNEPLSVHPW